MESILGDQKSYADSLLFIPILLSRISAGFKSNLLPFSHLVIILLYLQGFIFYIKQYFDFGVLQIVGAKSFLKDLIN